MSYRRSYKGDPRWITARFKSKCTGCDAPISKGDSAFYFPNGKSLYGDKCGCGRDQSASFDAAAFDEANNLCL